MAKIIEVYPFNLSFEIFRDEEKAKKIDSDKLIETLSSLSELEENVLKLRYEKKLTFEKIAEELGIDREKAVRVRDKSLRKLRHTTRVMLFSIVSYDLHYKQSSEYYKLQVKYDSLKKAYKEVSKDEYNEKTIERIVKYRDLTDTNISEMGFSVRIYNALTRSGINTLMELIQLSELDIISTRNLGEKSLLKINEVLEEYGVSLATTLQETTYN